MVCPSFKNNLETKPEQYKYFEVRGNFGFKIKKVKEEQFFDEPSKIFGGSGETVYKVYLYVNSGLKYIYQRTGKGKNPLSWKETLDCTYPSGGAGI